MPDLNNSNYHAVPKPPKGRPKKDPPSQPLSMLDPEPVQVEFPEHPLADPTDEWFIESFEKLYGLIETFFDTYFCQYSIDADDLSQPWSVNHTPEFINSRQGSEEIAPHGYPDAYT